MGSPKVLAGEQLTDHRLMVHRLVFFGIVAAFRVGVVPVQSLAAVFADTDGGIGVLGVELIEPGSVLLHAAAVPAKVVVVADHIRNMDIFFIHGTHGNAGDNRGTSGIHLVYQIVQHPVIFNHVRILGTVHGDLIAKAPHHDGGMVIALGDQFLHLQLSVGVGIAHMPGDIGDLRPDNHTPLVTQIIEILIVLIVRKANGVGTHFTDQVHVFPVVLGQ